MADSRAKIRRELSALVQEGRMIQLIELAKDSPKTLEQVLNMLAEPERKGRATGAKDKATRSKTSAQAATEEPKSSQATNRKLLEENFAPAYQRWYSRALRVVEQLLPDRYTEFREFHRHDKLPKTLDPSTYTISDYIQGIVVTRGYLSERVFDTAPVALGKFRSQIDILASAQARLESVLTDIQGVIEADLLDDELSAARELLKAKYLRAAGIVAGVVLERHLKRLIANHGVKFRRAPQIASTTPSRPPKSTISLNGGVSNTWEMCATSAGMMVNASQRLTRSKSSSQV